jgi:hypothetical protein
MEIIEKAFPSPERTPNGLSASLAGNDAEAVIVLNLVQPLAAGGQFIGFDWKARRDEPGREGTLQHAGTNKVVTRLLQPKLGRRRCSIRSRRPPSHLRRRGQVPARPNFRDGSGRFSVRCARQKAPTERGFSCR